MLADNGTLLNPIFPRSDEGATAGAPDSELPGPRTGRIEEGLRVEEPKPEEPAGALFGSFLHGGGGIRAECVYTGEVFTNMRGGIDTNDATKYMGLLDVGLTADLEKLALFPGGEFFLLGQDIHGQGLTELYVGDFNFLSDIDALPSTQVSEYWWQRSLLDGALTLRMGKQDCNAEFAVEEVAGDFISSSFSYHPTIPMPNEAYGDVVGGLVYRGLVPGRDEDLTGLGTFTTFISERVPQSSSERGVELFYRVHVRKHVAVQPDLQYIANPSGVHRDAFVAGVRFQLVL